MERRKSENLSDVILRVLREQGLETPLREHRAVEAWPKVVGEAVARSTSDVHIYNQKLYVRVSNPLIRTNLSYERTALVEKLNKAAGGQTITDIVLI